MQSKPSSPMLFLFPSSSMISAKIPGKGRVAQLGFKGVAPGKGVIICPPVSVCHQVSTIAHFEFPISS